MSITLSIESTRKQNPFAWFFSTCLYGLSLTIPGSNTKAHRVTGV